MSFQVDSDAIAALATHLRTSYDDLMAGKNYVHEHGEFGFHETGLIGLLAGDHTAWLGQLDQMFGHLLTVTLQSQDGLYDIAARYDRTDVETAARVDASYPASPRPPVSRD